MTRPSRREYAALQSRWPFDGLTFFFEQFSGAAMHFGREVALQRPV